MDELGKRIGELGYDLVGLTKLVYMDSFAFWADDCVGGQCTKGCTNGCAECSPGCQNGGKHPI